MILIGVTTLIQSSTSLIPANNYNLFQDKAVVFIILFWIFICYILQKIFYNIGLKLKIW